MTPIDDIHDMQTLRARIDAVDSQLIALFAQRRALIARAARIKAAHGLPARIGWRVEQVVTNARQQAIEAGLDGDLIEAIWRQLVEAAIAQEDQHLNGERS